MTNPNSGKRFPNLKAMLCGASALFVVAAPSAAFAQASCQNDFAALNAKLEKQVASLNALTGGGKKKQLDPSAACPRLRSLSATERELLAYMKKEQSWCGIPDDLIQKFTERANNTSRIAGQACKAAQQQAQMRRQAEQGGPAGAAAAAQRPRLPAGPL